MFEKVRQFMGRKSASVMFGLGSVNGTIGDDLNSQALNGFEANVYVMACIQQKTKAMSGIEWSLYRKRGKTLREIDSHPILDLLDRPNPEHSRPSFIEDLIGYRELNGNSFLWANRGINNRKEPIELLVFRPDRMRPLIDYTIYQLIGWQYRIGANITPYAPNDILHLRYWNPDDDIMGMSPLRAVRESVMGSNEARIWNRRLIENGARPMGALTSQSSMTPEQRERLRDQFDGKYGGPTNAGRPVVLEAGMTWQEMGLSPADMSWLESQRLSAREICIAFNVPPELVGDSTVKTYSNYQEARKAFYTENILPSMDYLRDELNSWLVPMYGDASLYLDYDHDDIDALQEDRTSVYGRLSNADWLTINEKRAECGYEAIDGGDVMLIPMGKVPIGPDAEEMAPEPTPSNEPANEGEGKARR